MERAKTSRASFSHDLLSPLNTLDTKPSDYLPPSRTENPLAAATSTKSSFPLKLDKLPQSYTRGSSMSLSNSSLDNCLNRISFAEAHLQRSLDLSSDPEPQNYDYSSTNEPAEYKRSPTVRTINVDKTETLPKFPCVSVANIQFQHHILPLVQDLSNITDIKLHFIPSQKTICLTSKVYGTSKSIIVIPYIKIYKIQFIRRAVDPSSDWYIDLVLVLGGTSSPLDLSFFEKHGDANSKDEEHFKKFTTLRINLAKDCGKSREALENLLMTVISLSRHNIEFTETRDPYGEFEFRNTNNTNSGNYNSPTPPPKPVVKTTYTTTPSKVREEVPTMESLKASESVRLRSSSVRSLGKFSQSESALPSPKQYYDYGRRTSKRLKAISPSKSASPFKRDPDSFTYVDPDFESTDSVKLFSYPEGEIDSVLVTSHELERLEPGIWLNDTLIDFELKYLKGQLDEAMQKKIHVFSSFFYRRLSSTKLTKTDESDTSKTGFDLVKTWTRKVNLFEKDYVVVPICESLHWFLAIICHPSRALTDTEEDENSTCEDKDTTSQSSDSSLIVDLDPETEGEGTKIFIFDSLGLASRGKGAAVIRKLKTYLKLEAQDKLGRDVAKNACTGNSVKVPQQENYTDCGCFLLQFVDEFFKSIPAGIELQIIERGNDLSDWFEPVIAQNRRSIMKERIKQLAEDFAAREALKTPAEKSDTADQEDRSSDIEEIIM